MIDYAGIILIIFATVMFFIWIVLIFHMYEDHRTIRKILRFQDNIAVINLTLAKRKAEIENAKLDKLQEKLRSKGVI